MDRLIIPKFVTEAEEAAWLDGHREQISKRFGKARREGKLRYVLPKNLKEKLALRPLTIRVSEADIELAQKQAEAKGLPYQTYMKSLLHESLVAAERARHKRRKQQCRVLSVLSGVSQDR